MSTIFLHPARKTYYHRSDVPERLKPLLKGRAQIWRSLKTKDKDEAKARSAAWDSRVQRLFMTLKKNGDRMTETEREALVAHWLESELNYAEDCRALARNVSDAHREGQLDGLDIMYEQAYGALLGNDFVQVEREADALLKAAGLPVLDYQGADFGKLCRRLLQAQIEYAEVERDRWNGKRVSKGGAPAGQVAPASAVATPAPAGGPMFSEAVNQFLAENPRAARTEGQARIEFGKFMAVLGEDRRVNAISKADGRSYKDELMQTRKLHLVTVIKHHLPCLVCFDGVSARATLKKDLIPSKGWHLQRSRRASWQPNGDRSPMMSC